MCSSFSFWAFQVIRDRSSTENHVWYKASDERRKKNYIQKSKGLKDRYHKDLIRSDQSLSCVRLFATPWTAALQASLSNTNSWSSPRLTSIKSVMPSSHPSSQWCHPAISSCRPLLLLPPIPPSIRVFSKESTLCMRWPKYWSFNFSIIPSKEHPGLISFRMDWLDQINYK